MLRKLEKNASGAIMKKYLISSLVLYINISVKTPIKVMNHCYHPVVIRVNIKMKYNANINAADHIFTIRLVSLIC